MALTDDAKDFAAGSIKGAFFPLVLAGVVYLIAAEINKVKRGRF